MPCGRGCHAPVGRTLQGGGTRSWQRPGTQRSGVVPATLGNGVGATRCSFPANQPRCIVHPSEYTGVGSTAVVGNAMWPHPVPSQRLVIRAVTGPRQRERKQKTVDRRLYRSALLHQAGQGQNAPRPAGHFISLVVPLLWGPIGRPLVVGRCQTRSVRAIAARWETERVGVAPLGSLHPDHHWSFVWDRRVLVARRHLARSSSHIGLIRGYVAVFNEDRPVGRRYATGSPGRVDDGWRSEPPMGSLQ
jgi:hypothetical protein